MPRTTSEVMRRPSDTQGQTTTSGWQLLDLVEKMEPQLTRSSGEMELLPTRSSGEMELLPTRSSGENGTSFH